MNQAVAELDPYGVFANAFSAALGIRWPKQGENFALALGANECDCGVESEPVCAFCERRDHPSYCRAGCAGHAHEELLEGPCDSFEFAPCGPNDGRTCVYERKQREHDPLADPVATY
jgi:hypothetical protein